jgi:RNA polymerase-binding protein DksA
VKRGHARPVETKTRPSVASSKAPVPTKVNGKSVVVAASGRPKSPVDRRIGSAPRAEPVAVVNAPARKKVRREKVKEPPRPLVPLPPPPVTTDSKPKKNLAGLSVKELDAFRSLLLAKRRELLGDMSSMEREALQSGQGSNLSNLPVHMADMGTDNYEQEFTLGLVEKDRQLLREINHALAKIQDGTYGICEGTGKPINKQRLEIQPWARFSIEHARALEKNMMIRR